MFFQFLLSRARKKVKAKRCLTLTFCLLNQNMLCVLPPIAMRDRTYFFVSSSFTSSYSASTTLSSAFLPSAFAPPSASLRFRRFFVKLHRKLLNDCLKLIFFRFDVFNFVFLDSGFQRVFRVVCFFHLLFVHFAFQIF